MHTFAPYKIKALLAKQGKRQKDLAGFVGISGNNLSRQLCGKVRIQADTLAKIADFFQVRIDELYEETQEMQGEKLQS